MRNPPCAVVAAAALLSLSAAVQQASTAAQQGMLLTIPQRDALRTRSSPPTASISADGRFIAFTSYERLSPADTDSMSDIYVLDRVTGAATLVSATLEGRPIDGDCAVPRISGDGRFVAFEAPLIAENDAVTTYIVLADLRDGTTRAVSRGRAGRPPNGRSADAALADGADTIVFTSTATNLVPGTDANGPLSDVYAFDRASGVIRLVSLDARGRQPTAGASLAATISGDGRYIAFVSTAALTAEPLARGPAGAPMAQVYLHDVQLGTTRLVRRGDAVPDGFSRAPAISRDGRFLAFVSTATNLVPNDRNGLPDVFLYDAASGEITLVSRAPSGRPANGESGAPAISNDGRFIAFQSDASDLACTERCSREHEDINLLSDVFVFDRETGTISRVSGDGDGIWMEPSAAPAVDGSGRIVAFTSTHPIDTSDTDFDYDLFVRVAGG